jgi:DNA-binding transcriptional LysR family regulator
MNLNHFRTFAALAETGSFTAAARRLGMPASTVSDHIAALESALGLRLVIRSTRRARLTAAGADLAQDARRMADAADDALARAATARAEPQGLVRLSLPFALARDLLAPLLGRFLADLPRVTLDLQLSNRRDDLIEDGIDLALRAGPPPTEAPAALLRRVIARAGQGLFAAPAVAHTTDLATLPLFAFGPLTLPGPDGAPVTLHPRLTANDPETLARAAAAAGGVTQVPTFVARAAGLVPILPHLAQPPADIALLSAARISGQPAAARLAAFLAAEIPAALAAAERA